MPDELVPLLTKVICKDTRSNDQQEIDSILFDFGGQLVYYVTHPLFLTPRAIYLLTYDLSRNPNDRASQWMTEGRSTKREESLCLDTNWDYLDSWLSSVASLANQSCLNEASSRNSENMPEKLPAVLLVCTHADRPYCTNTASSLAAGIFESLQGKPYSGHLYKGVFAVDNTKSGRWFWCPEVKRLRKAILDVANELPHSEEDLPIKWLKFEKELKAKVEEGHRWITFESARQTAFGRCHISDEKEFLKLMNYLHNQRIVIHFANTLSLNELVVLDIQWLIDVFKKVITVEPHGVEGSQCRERWLKFAKTGILDEELLEHLWGDLNKQKETIQSLTKIMEKFSLMCTWPSLNGRKQYLVPSMLISHPSEEVKSLVASSRLPSLYISFHSCQVPTSLFPRMVLQFYQWCSEEWPNLYQPQLYHNFARFLILPEEGCSIILLSHSSFIEVVAHQATGICDASNGSGGNSDFPTSVTEHTSDVLVARAVRRQLVLMLECMRKEFPWLKDMKWKLKVLCSVCCRGNSVIYCRDHGVKGCKKEQCLHFWSEANFATDQQFVVCDRSACAADLRLDIRKFAPWFNFLEVQQVQVDRDWCSSKKLSSSKEKEAKELVLSSGAIDFLHSTSNASSVVVPILNKLQLSQEALTNPLPETTRIVRSLVRVAKRENRYDVVKHLKEMTPAGTAGPILPEELDLLNISPSKLKELAINLCGKTVNYPS
ncbi:uncharacterized protein LOC111335610 isoform X1 [Stylophora pistillata]|uniref:uncharacterized protein LOC111335610 isoform X1 n=1 Tax=Stylophora pistillata TaxID=50429 RepID=UPI000C039AFF|nr:uncharacterized protein LOC111335610 isoform X1 [Stylophora pistillata]XP_022797301.1 uncharacterized protein LOC111335610 isoform X1 [Stylophora pistillata]XP_022797302.1 uncharacterized protein LOC111335610 isoform X1 [Stylophora pistillata]XP_022797303.1 uncharacterized protein LOC111335610 isoform X1 [Stylophora pistillata]